MNHRQSIRIAGAIHLQSRRINRPGEQRRAIHGKTNFWSIGVLFKLKHKLICHAVIRIGSRADNDQISSNLVIKSDQPERVEIDPGEIDRVVPRTAEQRNVIQTAVGRISDSDRVIPAASQNHQVFHRANVEGECHQARPENHQASITREHVEGICSGRRSVDHQSVLTSAAIDPVRAVAIVPLNCVGEFRASDRVGTGARDDQHARRDHQSRRRAPAEKAATRVDGEPVEFPAGLLVMLHKPAGYVCTHDDREGPAIYDLLPPRWRQRNPAVTSVGRLDKDTTGVLLVTDLGELVQRWTSPKHKLPKVYDLTVNGDIPAALVEVFASGTLMLEGEEKACLPARLEIVSARQAKLELTEGRYHQVKRMFASARLEVTRLHRSRFGDIELQDLPEGQWRLLPLPNS